ncbi:hypothetical protein BH10ACI3_BH10ACI3_23060 [soil metagenome]
MHWKIIDQYPDRETEQLWEEFLDNASYATHYTTPNFFRDPFVGDVGRFAVLAIHGGRIDAALTGINADNEVISGLAVRPQTAFRKGCDRSEAAKVLIDGVLAKGGNDLELIKFCSWEQIDGLEDIGFRRETAKRAEATIMLDLTKGADALFKDFSQTRRNELRKVMKLGLMEIKEIETRDEMLQLYEIHKDWNVRKGNKPNSFEKFQTSIEQRNHRKVFIAVCEGKVIAGSFYRFCRGGMVEYAANNSLEEYQRLRPNDLIGWRAIEWACAGGFTHFSMGGSHLFLRRFGGESVSTYKYSLDRTFLKLHDKREQLSRLAQKTYLSLPDSIRRGIRTVAAKS